VSLAGRPAPTSLLLLMAVEVPVALVGELEVGSAFSESGFTPEVAFDSPSFGGSLPS